MGNRLTRSKAARKATRLPEPQTPLDSRIVPRSTARPRLIRHDMPLHSNQFKRKQRVTISRISSRINRLTLGHRHGPQPSKVHL